ncbi:MAG: hypothetical protein LBU65_10680 [Planctomycetaceae bacterium]|jgi:hypothetical protein|nr:hypothetical protein [Planctomycetaceae bacterium]
MTETIAIAAGVIVLVAMFVVLFRSKKTTANNTPPQLDAVPIGQPHNSQRLDKALPMGIFPSEWFAQTDEQKLTQYIDCLKNDTVNVFTETFENIKKVPSPEQLQEAAKKLAIALNTRTTSNDLFAILNSNVPLAPKESQFIVSHLNKLLPTFKLPNPMSINGDIPIATLAFIAAVGSFLGFIAGGSIVGYLGNTPAETGHLFGTLAGAFLAVAGALKIANNAKLRDFLLKSVAGVAAVDTVWQIIKGILRPSFIPAWLIGGKRDSYWKRLLFYAGVFAILFLLKRSLAYDYNRFESDTRDAVEQYIRSVLPIIVVLMFQAKIKQEAGIKSENDKLVLACVPIIQRCRLQDQEDADEIVQEFEKFGFKFESLPTKQNGTGLPQRAELVWSAELEKEYETFGYITYGKTVEVTKPPVIQNGEVVTKGEVKKKR